LPYLAAAIAVKPKLFLFLAAGLLLGTSGCLSLGPRSLKADQVDYARALGDARKRQILSTIVGLRYADAPAVLDVSQIIASYTFDATGGATVNSRPDPGGPMAEGTGMVSYSNHPTFTFTPATGEDYASAYIRPLASTLILPLAETGIPIDLLLRITVQSIGNLKNGTILGGSSGSGSPEFFELLAVLRRLQLAGDLTVQYRQDPKGSHVSLALAPERPGDASDRVADKARVRSLLHLSPRQKAYDFVGAPGSGGDAIPVTTRSVLAILSALGGEIEVPVEQVQSGATKETIALVGGETRPIIVIHAARKAPADTYVTVAYRGSEYWIDASDFDSKYAFTVVQDLMALAQATGTSKVPIVTIPAS
jgi:hypothetical protein